MCTAHHRAGAGAGALRAGDGARAQLHDQEGPDQHGRAGSHTASAPSSASLRECPPCSFTCCSPVYASLTRCCCVCRRMSLSSVPGLRGWLLHDSYKTLALRLQSWPRPISRLRILATDSPAGFCWVTGGGAGGEGENWRPGLGRRFSGRHCRSRSTNCQWLHKQPRRSDV